MCFVKSHIRTIQRILAYICHRISAYRNNRYPVLLFIHNHKLNAVCPGFIAILGFRFHLTGRIHSCIQDTCNQIIVVIFLTLICNIPVSTSCIIGSSSDIHRLLILKLPVYACKTNQQNHNTYNHATDNPSSSELLLLTMMPMVMMVVMTTSSIFHSSFSCLQNSYPSGHLYLPHHSRIHSHIHNVFQ